MTNEQIMERRFERDKQWNKDQNWVRCVVCNSPHPTSPFVVVVKTEDSKKYAHIGCLRRY